MKFFTVILLLTFMVGVNLYASEDQAHLASEEQVLDKLKEDSFKNLSKEKQLAYLERFNELQHEKEVNGEEDLEYISKKDFYKNASASYKNLLKEIQAKKIHQAVGIKIKDSINAFHATMNKELTKDEYKKLFDHAKVKEMEYDKFEKQIKEKLAEKKPLNKKEKAWIQTFTPEKFEADLISKHEQAIKERAVASSECEFSPNRESCSTPEGHLYVRDDEGLANMGRYEGRNATLDDRMFVEPTEWVHGARPE